MSWTDEEIDKLAQENAANSSFEYKNEYWTEFEAMLPKKSKGDGFVWFFSAFLFVGLIGTSLVFNESFKNSTNPLNVKQDKITSTTLASNTTDNIQKSENTILTNKEIQQNTIVTNSKDVSTKSPDNKTNNKSNYNSASASTFNKKNIKPNSLAIALGNANGKLVKNKTSEKVIIDKEQKLDGVNQVNKSNQIGSLLDENISKLPLLGLKSQETNSPEIMPMETLHNERELPAKASFYVLALGGVSQSLITPSNNISSSFGLGLGAQIQKGRFTFTTGINGIWSNHKDLNLTRSAKVYGFGSSLYNYEFKYKQIYTLEAELTAGYKFGRHLINVGVRPSYIVGTKVSITESVDEKNNIERNEYGHVNGLNRFGIKPMIGYSFDITNSLKVGLNVGVEMMPKIQEGFLEGSNNRFPIDGQIYLRHSLKFRR